MNDAIISKASNKKGVAKKRANGLKKNILSQAIAFGIIFGSLNNIVFHHDKKTNFKLQIIKNWLKLKRRLLLCLGCLYIHICQFKYLTDKIA